MQLLNQTFNSSDQIYKFIAIIFFGFLPISFIFGVAIINLNIILLDILLLIYCFNFNKWKWIKNNLFKSLLFLYFFLIFNSIFAYYFMLPFQQLPLRLEFSNSPDGIMRSISFIKFILLIYAFKILILNYEILDKIIKVWLFIVLITIFDIFFEKLFGKNILGFVSPDSTRIISFFKDELVVGAFIYCFGFAVVSFYLSKKNENIKKKIIFSLILILIPLSVFITGERSNFIKSLFLFLLIIFFIEKYKLIFNKKIIFIFLLTSTVLLFTFNETINIKYTEFFKRILVVEKNEKLINKFENIKYFAHYDTAIKIFKNYPLLGIGNKNFRKECAKPKYHNPNHKFTIQRCSTHPHQIHFELLSEHGLLGYFIIIFILFRNLFKNFCYYKRKKDIFLLSNLCFLLLFFIPLLPGGGIFSTFNGALFWTIFSLSNLKFERK